MIKFDKEKWTRLGLATDGVDKEEFIHIEEGDEENNIYSSYVIVKDDAITNLRNRLSGEVKEKHDAIFALDSERRDQLILQRQAAIDAANGVPATTNPEDIAPVKEPVEEPIE